MPLWGLLCLLLLTRAIMFFREQPADVWKSVLAALVLPVATALWLVMTPEWWAWLALVFVVHAVCLWWEKSVSGDSTLRGQTGDAPSAERRPRTVVPEPRLVSLAVSVSGAWLAAGLSPPRLGPLSLALMEVVCEGASAWRVSYSGEHALCWLLLLLMSLSESNRMVGTLMRLWRLQPADADREKMLFAADLVGILERLLVFVVIAFQAFNAAAFILTAKGLVRFHETKEPETASYVLVGTLLSSALAFLWAILALWLTGKL